MGIRVIVFLGLSMFAGAVACSGGVEPPDGISDAHPDEIAAVGDVSSAASVTAGRRHFENRQPAANGRACATCHPSSSAFTLTPAQVERMFQANPRDPLFASIDADDFQRDFTTLRSRALIRVALPLPSNVADEDAPSRRTIDVWRAIPTVVNTALTAPFILDGRGATLEEQALGAIGGHFQPHVILPRPIMEQIAAYEQSLFSSTLVETAARAARGATPADVEPPLNALQQQGKATFDQFCVACHGGLARDTPRFANRFVSVRVSETNGSHLGSKRLAFTNPDGTVTHVVSPDPGRALITGKSGDVNTFDIPPLRGIRLTAPYFHDHSAATLEEVVRHYNANFFAPAGRPQVPGSGIPALVAYLEAI
jgi:cytochrome c peroxidase